MCTFEQVINIGFKYLVVPVNHDKDVKTESKENVSCFSEMVQTYCVALVCPIKEVNTAHEVWKKMNQHKDIIPKLTEQELFW